MQDLTDDVVMQSNTMHLWYSKSHSACSWEGPSGLTYAPGGDLLFSTSRNVAQTWNTSVRHSCSSMSSPKLVMIMVMHTLKVAERFS